MGVKYVSTRPGSDSDGAVNIDAEVCADVDSDEDSEDVL